MKGHIVLLCIILLYAETNGQPLGLVPYRKGNLWGYSKTDGTVVIEPAFQRTYFFSSDSLARVKLNGLYGFIDVRGKVRIKPQYKSAGDFYLGTAPVETEQKKFCINLEGSEDECNTTEEEETEEPEEQTYFLVEKDSLGYSLIINATQDTIKERFDHIEIIGKYFFPKVNYFAIVTKNGLQGAYNEQGISVAPVEFKKLDILDMDSYKAVIDKHWGVKYFNGETVIPFEYDSIVKVTEILFLDNVKKNDQYIVGKHKKFGVADSKHHLVLKIIYDEIQIPKECSCPTEYVIGTKGLYGLADHKGKIIVPLKYKSIKPFHSSPVTEVITATGKEGYIGRSGLEYFRE